MRDTPEGIVEELRLSARMDALELGCAIEDLTATEAADYIDHLRAALQLIASGAEDPAAVARQALDVALWMSRRPTR